MDIEELLKEGPSLTLTPRSGTGTSSRGEKSRAESL